MNTVNPASQPKWGQSPLWRIVDASVWRCTRPMLVKHLLVRLLGSLARLAITLRMGPAMRLVQDALDRLFLALGRPPLRVSFGGFTICGFLRHRSFLEGIVRGSYEALSVELFDQALSPEATVIDGGAHIGLYSLIASRRIAGESRVFAFEPDPYNFEALAYNLRVNRCLNVQAFSHALSDTSKPMSFFVGKANISGSLFRRSNRGELKELLVRATTVDDAVNVISASRLVAKLDVEGAESKALKGMERTLSSMESVVLLVELNPDALSAARGHQDDLLEMLQKREFSVSLIDEKAKALVPIGDLDATVDGNLYCVRNESARERSSLDSTNPRLLG